MTIGNRIKEFRKVNNLTQAEFAEKIGLKQAVIGMYENGTRNIIDRNISLISEKFNINETWLRTGEGEMLNESKDSTISQVTDLLKLDETEQSFLSAYLNLSYEQRQNFKESIRNFVTSYNKLKNTEIAATITARPVRNDKKLTKAEKIALMHQQLDEEEKAQTSSASTIISGFGGEKMA